MTAVLVWLVNRITIITDVFQLYRIWLYLRSCVHKIWKYTYLFKHSIQRIPLIRPSILQNLLFITIYLRKIRIYVNIQRLFNRVIRINNGLAHQKSAVEPSSHSSRISRDVRDLWHDVPRSEETSPGTPNVKMTKMITSGQRNLT